MGQLAVEGVGEIHLLVGMVVESGGLHLVLICWMDGFIAVAQHALTI